MNAPCYGAFTHKDDGTEFRVGGFDHNGPDGTPSALFSYSVDGCIRQVVRRARETAARYPYTVEIRNLQTGAMVLSFSLVTDPTA